MWAKNWRGDSVNPQVLLNRYRMKIGASPVPGNRRVVGLQETSGRSELRNVITDTMDPVAFKWTWKQRQADGDSPVDVATIKLWDDVTAGDINGVNLTVNNHSYYWPGAGQDGAHIVYPAEGGDQVSGWGLAQDLPDQPTGDNRYQTLIVYWGKEGQTPIPDPDPDPGPGPHPDPQPGSYPQPTGRLYGIHGPKDKFHDDDYTKIGRIKPGLNVVTDPNMDKETAARLRTLSPGVFILGRFFGSPDVNAWRPPYWDHARMEAYGRYCKERANAIGLDGAVFANEPGIDDPDQQDVPYFGAFWWTKAGYEMLAAGCLAWINGWDSIPGRCLAGTLPLSPGHHEDDDPDGQGYTGGAILAPVFKRFPLKVFHNYYHRGMGSETDPYFGARVVRQAAIYGIDLDRDPWCVSEWNRDEPKDAPFGDAEKQQDVVQSERFIQQHRNRAGCLGLARFIWRSDSYPLLSIHDRSEQLALAERLNTAAPPVPDPEVPVPIRNIECQIVRTESGLAVVGKSYRAIFHISRKDNGQAVPAGSILSVSMNYTRTIIDGVDTAPVPPFVKFYQVESGGRVVADLPIPANTIPSATASEGAYIETGILGLADLDPAVPGTDTQFTGQAVFPVDIITEAPNPPPPGPNPDQPGPTPEPSKTSLWAYLVAIHNNAGDVDNAIRAGDIPKAVDLNLNNQRWVKDIKGLIGFP